MADNPIPLFRSATAVADRVVAAVPVDQLDAPTPCADWRVHDVINHLVTGNLLAVSLITGDPPPDRSADHLGDQPLAALRDSLRRLDKAFTTDGVLTRRYRGPVGETPGSRLVWMRTAELAVHAWDIARATAQPTDLDQYLAEIVLATFRAGPALPRGDGAPFGVEQPAPPDATAADRLAAFLGRRVD
ncbi:MAG TPA: TIGR03086 family metal-binding protein [Micromonosporaceae bacterium]